MGTVTVERMLFSEFWISVLLRVKSFAVVGVMYLSGADYRTRPCMGYQFHLFGDRGRCRSRARRQGWSLFGGRQEGRCRPDARLG